MRNTDLQDSNEPHQVNEIAYWYEKKPYGANRKGAEREINLLRGIHLKLKSVEKF